MELFGRLPRIVWHPKINEQIVPLETQQKYPALSEDFKFLEEYLLEHFRTFDNDALRAQNAFWREQLFLIVGGAGATILGAIQATFTGLSWPGLIEGILAIVLVGATQHLKRVKAQEIYFTSRLKAEALRSEYFLFLGRIDRYADNNNRQQQLIKRVTAIFDEVQTQ
jgi:Protein of unknown function (DUF4231)